MRESTSLESNPGHLGQSQIGFQQSRHFFPIPSSNHFVYVTLTQYLLCWQVASNHGIITFIESSPSSDLLYIGEQRGLVYVYMETGRRHRRPFLDLRSDTVISRVRRRLWYRHSGRFLSGIRNPTSLFGNCCQVILY